MTLRDIKAGKCAVILKIEGEPAIARRLLDMGLTKGTKVKVVKTAPLGDPIEIAVRGYNLTLRKNEAAQISVIQAVQERPLRKNFMSFK